VSFLENVVESVGEIKTLEVNRRHFKNGGKPFGR